MEEKLLYIALESVIIFLVVFLLYTFVINRKRKVYTEGKKNNEIRFFITKYNLDMRKTSYKKLLMIVTLMNSFIITFASVVLMNFKSMIWGLLTSFVLIIALIYVLYEVAGRYLKRKEEKDE